MTTSWERSALGRKPATHRLVNGMMGLIQELRGVALVHGLTPRFDKMGFRTHDTVTAIPHRSQMTHYNVGNVVASRHESTSWLCYAEPIRSVDPGR